MPERDMSRASDVLDYRKFGLFERSLLFVFSLIVWAILFVLIVDVAGPSEDFQIANYAIVGLLAIAYWAKPALYGLNELWRYAHAR